MQHVKGICVSVPVCVCYWLNAYALAEGCAEVCATCSSCCHEQRAAGVYHNAVLHTHVASWCCAHLLTGDVGACYKTVNDTIARLAPTCKGTQCDLVEQNCSHTVSCLGCTKAEQAQQTLPAYGPLASTAVGQPWVRMLEAQHSTLELPSNKSGGAFWHACCTSAAAFPCDDHILLLQQRVEP
jgi:hypothetical protein